MKEKLVEEWFKRGERDLRGAEILKSHEECLELVVFLIHQAVEKFLKGYLISNGWKLKRLHDLETLISEALQYEPSLDKFIDFGRALTAYYYEERYPPGPSTSFGEREISELFETAGS